MTHLTEDLPLLMAQSMSLQLRENDWKAGWQDMGPHNLVQRAERELRELRQAIRDGRPLEQVWGEAADVANYVAMAASVYQERQEAKL